MFSLVILCPWCSCSFVFLFPWYLFSYILVPPGDLVHMVFPSSFVLSASGGGVWEDGCVKGGVLGIGGFKAKVGDWRL